VPDDLDPGRQDEQARADLEAALRDVAASKFSAIKNVKSELIVSRNPAAALCNHADELDVGLIVVGAQGRTGHDRELIGGVAEKVLRHAPCSVLTVRPKPKTATRRPTG
jgi:nucleotide-binding universal stress UspA family protein